MSQNPISAIFCDRPMPLESLVNGNEKQSLPIQIFMVIYNCCLTMVESVVVQENMKSNICDFSLFKCSFFNVLRETIACRVFGELQWETKIVYLSINLGNMYLLFNNNFDCCSRTEYEIEF